MLALARTAAQIRVLEDLFSVVELHETTLRGALPGARGQMNPVSAPLARALSAILEAKDRFERAGV